MHQPKIVVLFNWHLINGLVHTLFEATYIYNCFTSYIEAPNSPSRGSNGSFLGHYDREYGNAHAENIFGSLWLDYAKADARYSGIDLTTLSLEIITVFLAGPLSLYIAARMHLAIHHHLKVSGATWFWATILASAELYGGLINFLPEWLSGCGNLDTEDLVHFWVYIVFFNVIWVVMPLWVLRCAHEEIDRGSETAEKSLSIAHVAKALAVGG